MGRLDLRNGDIVSGAVLAALGVFIVLQARKWNYYSPDGPGPAFFPIWYGVAMVALSLVLVVRSALRPDANGGGPADRAAIARALGTWLAFAVTAGLMGVLGFLISFALFTFFLVAVIFRRSLLAAGVTALATAVLFHLTFPVALSVALPTGWFGF